MVQTSKIFQLAGAKTYTKNKLSRGDRVIHFLLKKSLLMNKLKNKLSFAGLDSSIVLSQRNGSLKMDEAKLVIRIDRDTPICLTDLSAGLNSIANLYNNFTRNDKKAKLLVQEIKKGSIIIDLVTLSAVSIMPLISQTNNIIEFCHNIYLIMQYCKKINPEEIEKIKTEYHLPTPDNQSLKDAGKVYSLVENSKDTLNVSAQNITTGDIYFTMNFNGTEAREMKNNIIELTSDGATHIFNKMLFRWEQTNFNDAKKTGCRGLIEQIHQHPLRVVFDSDEIKKQMTTSKDKEWHKYFYTVDVEAQTSDNKPVQYKILNNHLEDSFPIEGCQIIPMNFKNR